MEFRTAFLQAAAQAKGLKANEKKVLKHIMEEDGDRKRMGPLRRLFWSRLESHAREAYYRETGKTLVGAFDWKLLIDWLVKNLPTLLSLFMLFL